MHVWIYIGTLGLWTRLSMTAEIATPKLHGTNIWDGTSGNLPGDNLNLNLIQFAGTLSASL